MVILNLFSPHKRLPQPWRGTLSEQLGAKPVTLAWSTTLQGLVVGMSSALAVAKGSAESHRWQVIGWHEIESGGWNSDDRQLVWVLNNGARGQANLAEPGQFPELFKERISASIVLRQYVEIDDTRNGLTVSARRRLDESDAELIWQCTPGKGTRMSDPAVAAAAERAVSHLRSQYDFS